MKLTFASWNVNNRLLRTSHLDFLQMIDPDILALQEVSPKFFKSLSESHLFENSSYSLDLQFNKGEKRSRQLGCALFVKRPLLTSDSWLLDSLPFPERALFARVTAPNFLLTTCSFHTPPGASWKELKPKSHSLFAEWLQSQNSRFVFGIDANAPKIDHPDFDQNQWWWKAEPLLLGVNAIHSLKDAYRIYLYSHPEEFERIRRERPEGPLAISYKRGNRRVNRIDSRYDFVFVTSDINVYEVVYLYDDAIQAVSDHALVRTILEVPESD